jgi:formylglycine-generating enzyme required for sulfatase activity
MNRFHTAGMLALSLVCTMGLTACPLDPRPGQKATFDGIQFQWCPQGILSMGSPVDEPGRESGETLHDVTLSQGFWMSTYEVTQAQWEAVMGANPSAFQGPDRPVEQVSWNDAQIFLEFLNDGVTDALYRLPTEAEWEYACRAGTTARFYWGEDIAAAQINANAWFKDNAGGETHPVGQKNPNPWGLYDMGGNVLEWCQDWYGDYPAGPVTDPQGPASGTYRAYRGGSWYYETGAARSASRNYGNPTDRGTDLGFRLLRTQN